MSLARIIEMVFKCLLQAGVKLIDYGVSSHMDATLVLNYCILILLILYITPLFTLLVRFQLTSHTIFYRIVKILRSERPTGWPQR